MTARARRLLTTGPPSRVGSVAAAVLGPAAACGLALALPHRSTAAAASILMLGVVAAAVYGGVASGIGAAVLSFLGLNYFFTVPFHTLKVRREEDLIALPVFLVVAAVVGALVARAVRERDRAERATREARAINRFTSRLLSEEPLKRLLETAAGELMGLFELSRCEITAAVEEEAVVVAVLRPGTGPGPAEGEPTARVPLGTDPALPGTLTVARPPGEPEFTDGERSLLEAFAGQVALALQRERYDTEVRNARLEAEASRLRAALFSSITHDLRTPLASIKASVSSLLDPEVVHDAEQREDLLRTSLEETDRLNRLVGNLLDLARMRADAIVPATSVMPLEDVVEAVLSRMRGTLRPFAVRTFFRPETPLVAIDPVQIDQVVTNLLENAARFSSPGTEIRIAVHPWQRSVELRVADQGPGIPPEERERVFEAFYRRDREPGRGGSGLGLAIAQAIVLAHGGRIRVEGTPGGGTAVVIQLPVAAAEGQGAPGEVVPPASAAPAEGRRRG